MELSYEILFASLYICFIGCVPVVLARLEPEGNKGYVAIAQVAALVVWLVGGLVLLTNTIKFQSSHWSGFRSLTVVESVYLLSQIITTVGYGDITPAYQRGQVVVAFYVLVCLFLIADVVSQISDAILKRVQDYAKKASVVASVAFRVAARRSSPRQADVGNSGKDDPKPEAKEDTSDDGEDDNDNDDDDKDV